MRHGQALRNYAKALFAFSTLAVVGACADSTVGPTTEAPAFVAPANFLKVGHSVVFRVDNSKGITHKIQDNVINIPANAICDLVTSGYGTSFWDKDCTPMRGSVVITATVLEGPNGEPYIDFEPAMRFAPDKEVTLFFRDNQYDRKKIAIKYCDNLGYCIDESLNDPSLRPFRVNKNIVGRRLGHFSGYVIAYDGDCPPAGCESNGMMRKSGYMVASGDDIKDVMKDDKDDSKKNDSEK